ncbi:MAG: penicillin acylase family protein [Sphingomonadales bacterium]|nr:penicillin acylase family protein [Sphingomonadales bacterium]
MKKYAVLLLLAALPMAPAGASEHKGVEIERTSYGVPHVTAPDYRKLGFGIGYAYASDNGCLLAEQIVTVNGERSLYFGKDGVALVGVDSFSNLTSDIFHRTYMDDRALATAWRKATPRSRQLLQGFMSGYNYHLRVAGADGAGAACKGAPWVRPMAMRDLYRMVEATSLLAGGATLSGAFAEAGQGPAPMPQSASASVVLPQFGLGSNGMAFGAEATDNKRGLVVANPHFPWNGINRFYQLHVTIPGKLDTMGVMLPPIPAVAIGFNRDVAWTHTVSTAARFTLAELDLAPNDPFSYRLDGRRHRLEQRDVAIPVRNPDGTVGRDIHKSWWSRLGPVVAAGEYGLGWSGRHAYALSDANRHNVDLVETWLRLAESGSVEAIDTALRDRLAIPWVNTIAADRAGDALYADIGRVPGIDADMSARCAPSTAAAALAPRIHVLRGDLSSCRWSAFLPASAMRAERRRDYVSNSNDSYWLINAQAARPKLAPILGPAATGQRFRTREALQTIERTLRAGDRYSPERGLDLILSNRNYSGILLADDAIALCGLAERPERLAAACETIVKWDRHSNLDSRGALLFREFWNRARLIPDVYSVPFDERDPLATPRGLAIGNAQTRAALFVALGDAVDALAKLGLKPDVTIAEGQRIMINGALKPVSGGDWYDGVLNLNLTRPVDGIGFEPFDGGSYIASIGFDDAGPVAEGLLVYGQSSDPASPYYFDQLDLYAAKGRYRLPFRRAEIEADPRFERQAIPDIKD